MRSQHQQQAWRAFAACHPRWKPDDMTQQQWTAQWFDNAGRAGKRYCASCPVREPCLADSLTPQAQHLSQGETLTGIRAGTGVSIRKPLLRAKPADQHHATTTCNCRRCRLFADILAGRAPRNRNTPGARCGKRSTYHRGCRCTACSEAAAYHLRITTCAEPLAA